MKRKNKKNNDRHPDRMPIITNTIDTVKEEPATNNGAFSLCRCICVFFFGLQIVTYIFQSYLLYFPSLALDTDNSPDRYHNFMDNGQSFNLTVTLIDETQGITKKLWFVPNLIYNYSYTSPLTKTVSLIITKEMENNVFILAEIKTKNRYFGIHRRKPHRSLLDTMNGIQNSKVDEKILDRKSVV